MEAQTNHAVRSPATRHQKIDKTWVEDVSGRGAVLGEREKVNPTLTLTLIIRPHFTTAHTESRLAHQAAVERHRTGRRLYYALQA